MIFENSLPKANFGQNIRDSPNGSLTADSRSLQTATLKAIRAAIDRYLRQPRNNKPWPIVDDSAFQKSNKVLNAVCKKLMQKGKFVPTIHKNPITCEQLQYLYETGQLNLASGIPWIRFNSFALHGFT